MDASDFSLCALFQQRKEYLQVKFDAEELSKIAQFRRGGTGDYGINLRELMSAVFASLAWGKFWSGGETHQLGHVRFWIDNMAAISWNNRKSTHIAGVENVMADAGSRVWQSTQHDQLFTNLSCGWKQVQIPATSKKLSQVWERFCEQVPSQNHREFTINATGQQWEEWCTWMEFPIWLPKKDMNGNSGQLGAFAVFLWRFGMNKLAQGNTYSTICAKLCAVRWYHRNNLGCDPGVDASHAILLRGIRRFTRPVAKQHPLSASMLRAVLSILDLQEPRSRLIWGGILLGYFFLLRRSEYLYIGMKHHDYILKLNDITFLDSQGNSTRRRVATRVQIRLTGAKNNQFGREEARYHDISGDAVLCPVAAARWIYKGAKAFKTVD